MVDGYRRNHRLPVGGLLWLFVEINGANHFVLNDPGAPAGLVDGPVPWTLPQDVSIATIVRWAGLFCRGFVENDDAALARIDADQSAFDEPVAVIAEPEPAPVEPSVCSSRRRIL